MRDLSSEELEIVGGGAGLDPASQGTSGDYPGRMYAGDGDGSPPSDGATGA